MLLFPFPQIVDPDRPPFPEDAQVPVEKRPVRERLTDDEIRAMRKEQIRDRSRAAVLALRQARLDRHQAAIKYRQQRAQRITRARRKRSDRLTIFVPWVSPAAMHRSNSRKLYGGQ